MGEELRVPAAEPPDDEPRGPDDFEVVRDPVWNTIRIDPLALRIVDTAVFQRLRNIRQLGHTYLVYPGATHTRFDHALGVYHLARRTMNLLAQRGELEDVDSLDRRLVPYAALLHDIGHYPFSHALEELGPERLSEHHEALTARFLSDPDLQAVLREIAPDAAERIELLIRGQSESPLRGLVSGSLDLDKIEYLNRDARFCGVPYGMVDVDRLIHALALLRDPETGTAEVGIHEKGVAALESLLFSKYQMFRNVYWHHAVRAATVLYKRMVENAVDWKLVSEEELIGQTDDGLLALVEARARASEDPRARGLVDQSIPALRYRRLPKRALEIQGDKLRNLPFGEWFYSDPEMTAKLEDRLALEIGARQGSVYIDYPEKPRMMGLDLLLLQREGGTVRLAQSGRAGLIDLPSIADGLYHSARVMRIFTDQRTRLPETPVLDLLSLSSSDLRARLDSPEPIL